MRGNNKNRRKRKRRPTLTPRFGPASVALEIGLIRLSLEIDEEVPMVVAKDHSASGQVLL